MIRFFAVKKGSSRTSEVRLKKLQILKVSVLSTTNNGCHGRYMTVCPDKAEGLKLNDSVNSTPDYLFRCC